jgi:hypothetical protein
MFVSYKSIKSIVIAANQQFKHHAVATVLVDDNAAYVSRCTIVVPTIEEDNKQ